MRSFKSHKIVQAAKIVAVRESTPNMVAHLLLSGEKEGVAVTNDWLTTHKPEAGGYFVRYADGYESYSPARAFEEGYLEITEITDEQLAALTGEHILQFFSFKHLPAKLQEISRPFAEQAYRIMERPRNPERTVALRKLLESKDACVRAELAVTVETQGRP